MDVGRNMPGVTGAEKQHAVVSQTFRVARQGVPNIGQKERVHKWLQRLIVRPFFGSIANLV
jgi:hypothetical protein